MRQNGYGALQATHARNRLLADAKRLLGPARAPTMAYRTGSGGWHLLYGVPGDGPVPTRSDDGGHRGMALQGDGRQTVEPPSGHVSGTPYRWPRGGPCWEIADLPAALREWAAERPSLAPAQAPAKAQVVAVPVRPARPAAEVDRDLRLHGVSAGLRGAVAAPYVASAQRREGYDDSRSGHWCRLTASLLRPPARVSDALLADAARVPEWGYGATYRDPGRGEGWPAAEIGRARAVRSAAVEVFLRRTRPQQGRGDGLEIGG